MSLNDPLASVLSHIMTEDAKGRRQVTVKPYSRVIMTVLNLLKDNNYLGDIKKIDDAKGSRIEVSLLGSINKTGVLKPRHSVTLYDYKKFEKRYLPAFGFGFLIVSTNQGIMTHEEAIKKKLGGKLLAFVY